MAISADTSLCRARVFRHANLPLTYQPGTACAVINHESRVNSGLPPSREAPADSLPACKKVERCSRTCARWCASGLRNSAARKLIARRVASSTSLRARSADTFLRAFKPRFISGNPPNAWRLARAIENTHPPLEIARPFYYWLTARAEPLLYRFVTTELCERAKSHDPEIRVTEAVSWIRNTVGEDGAKWTATVRLKVARGMLAALRDFGILEGANRKQIAPQHLALEAFCLIAFCLHKLGFEQKSLVCHPDWRLFLLNQRTVEQLFLEAHQNGWLDYQCIGEIYRIEFRRQNLSDYAHEVLGR